MNKEFLEAVTALCKEKGLSEDIVIEAIEAALVAACKKHINTSAAVEVKIDRETGNMRVFINREVIEEAPENDSKISLEEAKQIDPDAQIGSTVKVEIQAPKKFGRISAMTAKQVVMQRIRAAESGVIYSEYNEKTNDIVSGRVERIERGNVFVDIGKIEAYLPVNEQPPGEEYKVDDIIRCYVSEVRNGLRGTSILLSRTHPGLVRKLFEAEVPEIAEGIVEIKSVAREAGSRTKIAVHSTDPDIDAQGACIGPRGTRVQNIGDELRDEKIDIVKWSEDPVEYIAAALSPAKVLSTDINEEEMTAHVTVPEHQLSLAIGRAGQNVRLAARLTGWKIDISAQ